MSSDFYRKILDNNKNWVESQLAIDKEYFKDFWILCSITSYITVIVIADINLALLELFSISFEIMYFFRLKLDSFCFLNYQD